jgi:xanthine dehydrogenase YagT iron-sulfur-binding subunit
VLDLLHERLGLIGSEKGCDHGQCAACAVLIGGRRANACLALAMAHDGAEITTVEVLADRKTGGSAANDEDGAGLQPLQDAFLA